jgi:hypothetical protein
MFLSHPQSMTPDDITSDINYFSKRAYSIFLYVIHVTHAMYTHNSYETFS